jgi:hypothetical protein
MQHRILRSIRTFFEGTGSVLSTPSGDARGHVRMPIDTMFDAADSLHIYGR